MPREAIHRETRGHCGACVDTSGRGTLACASLPLSSRLSISMATKTKSAPLQNSLTQIDRAKSATGQENEEPQYVYNFGDGKADGDGR